MSAHHANISWRKTTDSFGYDDFNREHEWRFGDHTVVKASAAPGFNGDGASVDPEEAFVAALSSCHMLTFLALCARKRLTVERYEDRAVGYLEKNADGKLAVTRVELHPQIDFAPGIEVEDVAALHERAHAACFIANSVTTEVTVL
ncbi:MAG TPA: OsmC family protein [Gammaproteobacteria bacterium]|nr:OsmC family protein [Gammaproteobacteria bacterium]